MRERKLCGYDLNGWRDIAARNWFLRPGDEEEFIDEVLTHGGLLTSVVFAGEGENARWIGGSEAILAPHGRGGGWGHIGDPNRRKRVRSLIDGDSRDLKALTAAFAGLARHSDCAVAAIDDLPTTTETQQENLLNALLQTRANARLLVWRPVLVALYAIGQGLVQEGQRVGVICHAPEGFSLQILRIRRESGQYSALLAPERRVFGKSIRCSMGYQSLVNEAQALVMPVGSDRQDEGLEWLGAVGRLAMGQHALPELIRKGNGTWQEISVSRSLDLPQSNLSQVDFKDVAGCDVTLFESLTEGEIKTSLHRLLEETCQRTLPELPQSTVAAGALLAARRVAARDPVYFDFLPRISTIVQRPEGPQNFDLISADETLPAGRLYRSEEPAKLAVLGGQQRFTVYIRKEAERWPRKAVVDMGAPLPGTTPVDLFVEQAPASGRARILVHTPASRQFSVDWEMAEEIQEEWDSIIANLVLPLPTIPKKLILPCGMVGWEDDGLSPGLRRLLHANATRRAVDWEKLADKLIQRTNGAYCVSSDGSLPAGVSRDDVQRFDQLTGRALELLRNSAARRVQVDSGPVRYLTWQFQRCPKEVLDILLMAWEPGNALVQHPSTRVLFYQGVGRIVSDEVQEKAVLEKLLRKPVDKWNWRLETACAAFLLSRSDTAPLLLDRDQVELLGGRVLIEFAESLRSTYSKFHYAPFLLVGLLRWRLKEPRALVASTDALAKKLSAAVDAALLDLHDRMAGESAFRRYIPILEQIKTELEGEGTNPDLLLDIYTSS